MFHSRYRGKLFFPHPWICLGYNDDGCVRLAESLHKISRLTRLLRMRVLLSTHRDYYKQLHGSVQKSSGQFYTGELKHQIK